MTSILVQDLVRIVYINVTGSKTVYFMTIGVLRHIQSQETILCIKPLTPNVPFWHITPTLFVNDNL